MNIRSRFLIAILLLSLIAACLCPALADQDYKPYQIVDCESFVSLRAEPDQSSERLQKVYLHDVVMGSTWSTNGFTACCFNGQWGYIKDEYLSSQLSMHPATRYRVTNCKSYINLRAFPEDGAEKVIRVPKGERLDRLYNHVDFGDPEQWVYVVYDGTGGFTRWEYLEAES